MESHNVVLNYASNSQTPYVTQPLSLSPVVVDNKAGLIIRLKPHWSKVEYHEGKVIVYRDGDGSVSVIEVEYEDD